MDDTFYAPPAAVEGRVTPSHVDGVLSCGELAKSANVPSASAADVPPGFGPSATACTATRLNR